MSRRAGATVGVAADTASTVSAPPAAAVADPCANLPFTLSTIKAAIPQHCFEKNVWKSIFYLVRDFAFIGALYALYPLLLSATEPWTLARFAAKFAWWNAVGFFGWCLFVVGHDCGHRTFCESEWWCDVWGHIAHTPLLVPFHGWRVSHREHHLNHNHVDNDHSWKPIKMSAFAHFLADNLRARISYVLRFTHALLLIFPVYLLFDSSELTSGNHFNPWGRLFSKEERVGAAISAVSVATWLAFLLANFPLLTLLDAYFIPYLFFVAWLDLVTYLHHTDASVHYYRDGAWSYFKGSLSTVDRSYGRLIDHLHHDIGTHMLHHMFFTKIPHYHLVEATEAVKPMLGEHYKFDTTPALAAYLRTKAECHFVPDEGAVVQYQQHHDTSKQE